LDYSALSEDDLLEFLAKRESQSHLSKQQELSALERQSALQELLSRHYDWMARMCIYELRDESLAKDALQESLLAVVQGIHSFSKRSKFSTWSFTIVKRTCGRLRKRRRSDASLAESLALEADGEISSNENTDSAQFESFESRKTILNGVEQLPEKQRLAVFLHYFEDLSVEECAEKMNCSTGSIKTHLHRARKKLELVLNNE